MLKTSSFTPADLGGGGLRSPLIPPAKEPEPAVKQKLCIDDMLSQYCGEFGFWQLKHFVLTSLAWALEAFHTMVMIFADREPEWRCVVGGGACSSAAASVCGFEPGSWEWIGGPASSTVTEWGLVCGQKYKVGLVQSLFFGGCMIGKRYRIELIFYKDKIHAGPDKMNDSNHQNRSRDGPHEPEQQPPV